MPHSEQPNPDSDGYSLDTVKQFDDSDSGLPDSETIPRDLESFDPD